MSCPVLWIRFGFNAGPDPDPGSQTNADPDHKKFKWFKNMPTKGTKAFLKDRKSGFICKFWSMSILLDPDAYSQYGSGSRTAKRMRIHVDLNTQHWSCQHTSRDPCFGYEV